MFYHITVCNGKTNLVNELATFSCNSYINDSSGPGSNEILFIHGGIILWEKSLRKCMIMYHYKSNINSDINFTIPWIQKMWYGKTWDTSYKLRVTSYELKA